MGETAHIPDPTEPPVNVPPTAVGLDAFTLAYLQIHELECPACGYNVHRLVEPRCPECGRKLALQIVAAEGGFSTAWVVALIAQAIAGGLGLLLALLVAKEGLPPGDDWRYIFMKIDIFCLIGHVPLPLVLIALRRRFISWSTPVQWTMSLLMSLFSIGMFVWFILLIRR